jgi:tetratricopeptide (TPR) repeat protein
MDTGWLSPTEDGSSDWGQCPTCGTANTANARFCQACGRALGDPGSDPMTIDVLTAVVTELVSSNEAFALASDADARLVAVRDVFVAAGAILRDLPVSPHTVAAVFGPAARDGISTLTAVRAALAARDAATGGDVALRVGIGASDVRGDDDQAVELWRGRVVDLAFRLSRMAAPAEVILGEGAYRLIRDAIVAEVIDPRADPGGDDVGPLRLHGLREIDAWAVQPPSDETAEAASEPPAVDEESVATENRPIEPAYDLWAERFGSATTDGHDEAETPTAETPTSEAGEPAVAEADREEPFDIGVAAEFDVPAGFDLPSDGVIAETAWADTERDPSQPEAFEAGDGSEPGQAPQPIDQDVAGEPEEAFAPSTPSDPADVDDAAVFDHGASPRDTQGEALLEREAVLGRLHDVLDRAIERGRPVTITMGGEPGSGRTAAARWFAAQTADRAWTVELTCRSAEAGGTAWPFAAIVRALTGTDGATDQTALEARLREALAPDAFGHAAVLAASLHGDGGASVEETRAAIAALLTSTVARRPLIVIVDDADRAAATSRAVFDSVIELVDGPLLVILAGRESADVVVPPLSDHASAELVERLLARPNLPPDATASIVTACGGLPLAVEHLVAMLADDGHLRWEYGRWTPTVNLASLPLPADLPSLAARRIAGLDPAERRVAAAAAVVGRTFEPDIVASALDAGLDEVLDACTALTDRGILRRVGEDRFAFGHDLLAEAAVAYAERNVTRAMHLATADRLVKHGALGADVDEAIGAHLERAFRLTSGDGDREATGRRAAEHLVRAARGAADVGDEDASLILLRRAAAVLRSDDAERGLLLLDSAAALEAREERGSAERLLGDAIHAARTAGDELLELRALVARARLLATASRLEDQIEALRDAADAAIVTATARDDATTAATGWSARGWVYTVRGHFAGAAGAFEQAADAAAAAGRRRDELSALRDLSAAIVDGPAPVAETIDRCAALVKRTRGTSVEAEATAALAVLLARAGRKDDAAQTVERSRELSGDDATAVRIRAAFVARHAGGAGRAEESLGNAIVAAPRTTDRGAALASLAYVLTELGRTGEAVRAADDAASLADEDDVVSQVTWRAAKARCLAAAGEHADARALVRLALRLADQTDLSELRARTLLDLADVLLASGLANEAAPAARAALRALERKGSVAEAARARAILDRAAGRTPATTVNEETETVKTDPHEEASVEESPSTTAPERLEDQFLAPVVAPLDARTAPDESTAEESAESSKRHWFW